MFSAISRFARSEAIARTAWGGNGQCRRVSFPFCEVTRMFPRKRFFVPFGIVVASLSFGCSSSEATSKSLAEATERTIAACDAGLKSRPDDATLLARRAQGRLYQKSYASALQDVDAALKSKPDSASLAFLRYRILYAREGESGAAAAEKGVLDVAPLYRYTILIGGGDSVDHDFDEAIWHLVESGSDSLVTAKFESNWRLAAARLSARLWEPGIPDDARKRIAVALGSLGENVRSNVLQGQRVVESEAKSSAQFFAEKYRAQGPEEVTRRSAPDREFFSKVATAFDLALETIGKGRKK
jgi:hypothetical protein